MDRVTRADVARRAGVAPTTVSLILNGRGRDLKIAEATIERVRRAAADLNYIPNAAARSLKSGQSHLIALLLAELPDNPYVPVVHTVLTTAMIEIQKRGYLLLPLFQSSEDRSDAEMIRAVLGDTQLAGIIRETTSGEDFTSTLLANLGIPVVGMSMISNDSPHESPLVRIDEAAGVARVLEEFAPRNPASARAVFLAGPNTNHSRQQPLFEHFGARARMEILPDWDEPSAHARTLDLLREDPDIELIFCADDSQAPGVLHAAAELGLRVPEDLSVLGFGNHERPTGERTGLTTIDWPLHAMTRAAVDTIITCVEGRHCPPTTTISTTPVWRTSVRRRATGRHERWGE